MNQFFIKTLFLIISSPVFSQVFPFTNYPKDYFRNPLNIPISLAGNFGELRLNHYHMGLDIRTENRQNLPVYAAADGYVAKVKIEPGGFGQAVYINHPNGYTTLYAHLNEFFPALTAYIKQQQYNQESWKIFLDIPASFFPVKKSDLIAYSGNTGGSQAPHLHFEIRRTSDDVNLNPMLFGLPIPDNTPPTILRLAIYDRTKSIYEQTPKIFPARKAGSQYIINQGLVSVKFPKIGFAISAFDTQSGSSNPNGIYESVLYDNGQAVTGFRMDNISYDNTRDINAHIDYKTKADGGPFLQQLYRLPGYLYSIYQPVKGDGTIDVSDGSVHSIRIEVKDANGNSSELEYKVQYKPGIAGNWQMPGKKFYPLMLDGYETGDCAFYIGERCLYDSVHINYIKSNSSMPNVVSAVHSIGATDIPLEDSFLIRIKPNNNLPANKKNKVVMQRFAGTKKDVQKVEWQGGLASAKFRDFGNFQLVIDEKPPAILPIGIRNGANLSRASKIVFIIKDNLEEFKNFRAELDGKWLRFTNDKWKSFTYRFDEHCPRGKHELKVSVEDVAGNMVTRIFKFTR